MPKFDISGLLSADTCDNAIAVEVVVLLFSQHKPEVARFVLTDDWLLVVACHVMPLDTVSVEVVEDGHTGFLLSSLSVFSVIWLGHTIPASVRPVVELVAVGRRHFNLVGRPEPTIDQFGEELRLVAPVEVALAAGGPEELDSAIDEPLHPVVLLLGLKRHKVHTPFPAVVARVEPIPFCVPHPGILVQPAEVVVVSAKLLNSSKICPFPAERRVPKAQLALPIVQPPTIIRKEFVSSFRPERCICLRSKAENVSETEVDRTQEVVERSHDRPEEVLYEVAEAPLAMSRTSQ